MMFYFPRRFPDVLFLLLKKNYISRIHLTDCKNRNHPSYSFLSLLSIVFSNPHMLTPTKAQKGNMPKSVSAHRFNGLHRR